MTRLLTDVQSANQIFQQSKRFSEEDVQLKLPDIAVLELQKAT